MTGEWGQLLLAVVVTAAFLTAPGLVLLRALGFRGLALLAFAPVFSVAAIGLSAVLLGMLGVDWTPLSLCLVLVTMLPAAWLVGRRTAQGRLPTESAPPQRWLLPAAVGAGASVGLGRLMAYVQDPAGISQTNDAVFHMNAVRYILETADASSLHVNSMLGANGFYPAAWHAVVSVVVALTGVEVAVAANALTYIIGALIWPVGIAWFTRIVTGSSRIAAVAAVLSPSLQLFPLLMFQWGVLFPNALSVSMIPAATAAIISLPAWAGDRARGWSVLRGSIIVGVAVAAIGLAQPASLPIIGLVVAIWASDRLLRVMRGSRLALRLGALGVVWVLLALMWQALAGATGGSHWPPFRGKIEVFADILLNGQMRIPYAWVISVLMLAGLVAVFRAAWLRWLGAAWLALSALYVLVAAVGMPWIRDGLLAPWYADPYRISAFAPLIVIPLAAVGLDRLVSWAARNSGRRAGTWAGTAIALVIVTIIALFRPVPMPAFIEGTFDKDPRYLTTEESYLDVDERRLLEDLPEYVPAGERVIANPSTGAAFGYMFSGVDVYPRTWSPPRSSAWTTIAAGLRDAMDEPEVCEALAALGDPRYVLDFGEGEEGPGRYEMPGMTDFDGQPGFERVAVRGEASLWRINACGT